MNTSSGTTCHLLLKEKAFQVRMVRTHPDRTLQEGVLNNQPVTGGVTLAQLPEDDNGQYTEYRSANPG